MLVDAMWQQPFVFQFPTLCYIYGMSIALTYKYEHLVHIPKCPLEMLVDAMWQQPFVFQFPTSCYIYWYIYSAYLYHRETRVDK